MLKVGMPLITQNSAKESIPAFSHSPQDFVAARSYFLKSLFNYILASIRDQIWIWFGGHKMPTNLSIKKIPDKLVAHLHRRAKAHHRSLQGDLLSILEDGLREEPILTPKAILEKIRRAGLRSPSESVSMIRKDRDAR
jgi:plasmid stability protein